jgi:plasmid stabilization system protein ParE
MTFPVELLPAAEAEARGAYARYEQWSHSTATRFLFEFDRAISLIQEAPERWPQHVHGSRRYILRRFPFSVVYRVGDRSITVVAVSHQRKRPGYWRRRR